MCSMMSVHIKEHQMVKISGALHYDVSHNHIMVSGHKTPDIIIINSYQLCIKLSMYNYEI